MQSRWIAGLDRAPTVLRDEAVRNRTAGDPGHKRATTTGQQGSTTATLYRRFTRLRTFVDSPGLTSKLAMTPCLPICLPIDSTWTDQTGTRPDVGHAQHEHSARPSLADTEEVTGSNPVSPTSNTPGQRHISLARVWRLERLTCRPSLSAYRLPSPSKSSSIARAPRVITGRIPSGTRAR